MPLTIANTVTSPRAGFLSAAFDDWMQKVDATVESLVGLSVYDLPDCTFADWYEEGFTPRDAAREAITLANTY